MQLIDSNFEEWKRKQEAARKQAAEPIFTTRSNPLVELTPKEAQNDARINHNMRLLERDARLRENPRTGAVYSAIMNTRYGGQQ